MEYILIVIAVIILVIFAICFLFAWICGSFINAIEGKGRDALNNFLDRK
jgi:hypothetical protein